MKTIKNESTVWINFAAGDGCFVIGLGGKNEVLNPSYEPYKCCPTTVKKGTKVAKMTPAKDDDEKPKKSKGGGKEAKKEKEKPSKDKSAVSTEKSSKGKKGLQKYIWWW